MRYSHENQCAKAVWPIFHQQKFGRIVTTCSQVGICEWTPESDIDVDVDVLKMVTLARQMSVGCGFRQNIPHVICSVRDSEGCNHRPHAYARP